MVRAVSTPKDPRPVRSAATGEALRKVVRAGSLLALVGLLGFGLGACGGGGGGALSTRTDLTVTRTLPTRTVTTAETATTEVTTTAPGETTTVPAPAPTTAASSSSGTPWGWIILGVALALALLIGLLVWRRRRAGARAWGARTAELNRRALVALDDVLAKDSLVTGQVEALASEARSLEARAPDDPSRAAAASVRARLDELAGTLEADRALRLGSPPRATSSSRTRRP
jgi:hypothetical protein